MTCRSRRAIALAVLLVVSGCGSGSDRSPAADDSAPPTTFASGYTGWSTQTDPGSGVAFRLPDRATPQKTANGTIYQSVLSGDRFFVSASIVPNRLHLGLEQFARQLAQNMYANFSAIKNGPQVHDVLQPDLASRPLDGREAYDFWFGFVANENERTTWRITVTRCDETTVVLQTIDRVPESQDPRSLVLRAHRELRDGLTCPR